jgi:hypothetical protein
METSLSIAALVALIAPSLPGCATAETAPASSPAEAPLPPLPRSSIAAVLAHRNELRLTAEQVNALGELDDQLQKARAALESGARTRRAQGSPAGAAAGGSRMGGGGGMGRGMRGGRRMAGGRPGAGEVRQGTPLEQRLDDLDTEAYLHAESVLTEAQQGPAREIAEQYREALADRREAARQ